jgi:DNA repair protein RadC
MNIKYNEIQGIKSWAEDDRPREKLISKSAKALSDAELIAILLGSGTRKESAVDVAKNILASTNNNLIELSKLGIEDLVKFRGVGDVKAISIIAAMELGRRRRLCEGLAKRKIVCSKDAYEIMQPLVGDLKREEFWIICLDTRNQVIKNMCISQGSSSGTVVDPKEIFKIALDNNSKSIILCHNHPSGEPNPSQSDINITKKCVDAGKFLELSVVDHIIVSHDKFFSFADEGLL